jgi:hypothetical protein
VLGPSTWTDSRGARGRSVAVPAAGVSSYSHSALEGFLEASVLVGEQAAGEHAFRKRPNSKAHLPPRDRTVVSELISPKH